MRKPKYEIRRGFRAPTPSDPSTPDTATYEVWRKGTAFHAERLIDVFNHVAMAEATCNLMNQKAF